MIVVTGANGTLGRAVTERLLDTAPAGQVGVSVRDPEQAAGLAERGVRVRRGDFAEPATLTDAFEGATQVLVVSAGALGDIAVRLNRTAIAAAAQAVTQASAGGRVVYTSHMAASPDSLFPPMPTHAASEQALRESGVAFTSLRNGLLHQHGITPALTGPEAIDMTGVAEIASELLGRPLRRTTVSDDHYRAGLVASGAPQAAADLMVGMFRASRRGEFAAVDPTLPRLIGRSPVPVRDVLQAALVPQTGTS